MQFYSENIGRHILEEIENAQKVIIASAYFYPSEEEIKKLRDIPELEIFVSGEFHISNPYILKNLSKDAVVKSIPTSSYKGRFHAKVILCYRSNGSKVVFIGSANFTKSGLFNNHEVITQLDSSEQGAKIIQKIEDWINELNELSQSPNWKQAIDIYKEHQKKRTTIQPISNSNTNYWVLKTHSGQDGTDYWSYFQSESVVAIGWESLTIDPSKSTYEKIKENVGEVYPDMDRAARKIHTFANQWKKGDLLIICRGYPSTSSANVFFYGYGRIEDEFDCDANSDWWKFKYPTSIQQVELSLPKTIFTQSLNKKSLQETLHNISKEEFIKFRQEVKSQHGIRLEV